MLRFVGWPTVVTAIAALATAASAEESICPYMPKPMQAKCYADEKKPKLTNDQSELPRLIRESFLKAGIRASVVLGKPVATDSLGPKAKYPSLIIHGDGFDSVGIYQIESRLKIVEAARTVGYKSVVYLNTSYRGGYHNFDLTSPGKACSLDLCF